MLRWLFLDMNSYFASVEQHLQPELRGKPVAVAAMNVDSTACIAASYEAKAFGVRTGTLVGEARHMCPGLQVVLARPHLYVEMHHRIIALVEKHLHVDCVLSVDEMACRIPSNLNGEERVGDMARAIKEALAAEIGPCIRCSIGIAPNRYLAKVASDMQKPDGLVILHQADLPARLLPLKLRDFPGVGSKMELRLAAHGVDSVARLWELSPESMARAWGGVTGRHFWNNLHGQHVVEPPTQRRTIGHSNMLSPERRTDAGAYAVLVRLVHKAGARLRHMQFAAGHMGMHILYVDHSTWQAHVRLGDAQDTQTLLEAMTFLWSRRAAGTPKKVGIVLFGLERVKNVTLPLFAADARRLDLARAMDAINGAHGRQRIYFAEMHETRHAAPMRIAFTSVPDEDW